MQREMESVQSEQDGLMERLKEATVALSDQSKISNKQARQLQKAIEVRATMSLSYNYLIRMCKERFHNAKTRRTKLIRN